MIQESHSLSLLANVIFHILLMIILYIIADLSRILGEALKKKPVYKLMSFAYVFLLLGLTFAFFGKTFHLYAFGFDIIGLILGSLITYYYWKWLPGDLNRG